MFKQNARMGVRKRNQKDFSIFYGEIEFLVLRSSRVKYKFLESEDVDPRRQIARKRS